jgi:hypothetical protein
VQADLLSYTDKEVTFGASNPAPGNPPSEEIHQTGMNLACNNQSYEEQTKYKTKTSASHAVEECSELQVAA